MTELQREREREGKQETDKREVVVQRASYGGRTGSEEELINSADDSPPFLQPPSSHSMFGKVKKNPVIFYIQLQV